ncbi:hypothetical protein L202_07246 [Cryptococcus amylolentus CBS 6039]|uniref:Uncharacterized protein n=1 Tax=Cryptococcus amylolentus CBS 6039 TaxID=1295533 RepID=A0A1E3HBK1_9TREE|nr:hypothetical protein L202_07246 [Cryptococcus amylolentus CBS 6039]ODN73703.1 hypothetical protein L202_07246 [Cryptococcus amylolentus CBS 6039]
MDSRTSSVPPQDAARSVASSHGDKRVDNDREASSDESQGVHLAETTVETPHGQSHPQRQLIQDRVDVQRQRYRRFQQSPFQKSYVPSLRFSSIILIALVILYNLFGLGRNPSLPTLFNSQNLVEPILLHHLRTPWTGNIDPLNVQTFGCHYNIAIPLFGFGISFFYLYRHLITYPELFGIAHYGFRITGAVMGALLGAGTLWLAGRKGLRMLANRDLHQHAGSGLDGRKGCRWASF